MKRWSKLQKAIEALFVTEPQIRIQCRSYRMGSQRGSTNLPRYWVTLDKEAIWDYPKDFKVGVENGYPYQTDVSTISDLIRRYIDTPLEQLLIQSFDDDLWGLTDILRAADRRLGRERLQQWGRTLPSSSPARKVLAARFGIEENHPQGASGSDECQKTGSYPG